MKKNLAGWIRVLDVLLFLGIFIGLFWITKTILEMNDFSRGLHTTVQIVGLSISVLFAMFVSRYISTWLAKKYVVPTEEQKAQYTFKHKNKKHF